MFGAVAVVEVVRNALRLLKCSYGQLLKTISAYNHDQDRRPWP